MFSQRNIRLPALALLLTLVGCTTVRQTDVRPAPTTTKLVPAPRREPAPTVIQGGIDDYKYALAQQIYAANPERINPGRPQALLRSVVVLKLALDRQGNLVHSSIVRSNHDPETESAALNSVRRAGTFPVASDSLFNHGKVELLETWLFNDDGRFQLRTLAKPQLSE